MQKTEIKVNKLGQLAKTIKREYMLYLFVLPTVLWYIVFCYFPMAGVYTAFTDYNGVGNMFKAEFVGLKWFRKFFNSAYAKSTIVNTLRISLYSLAVFPLPIIMAVLLNMVANEKVKKVSQTIMYAPHFISLVVLSSMISLLFDANGGLVNTILKGLGYEAYNFIGSADAFPHLFVWSGVWQSLGWDCIIYVAALSGVDPALHEAAKMDGCSRLKRIWYVDLPTIMPTIVIMLIMRVGKLMSVSTEKTLLFRNTVNMATSETVGTFVYFRGLINGDMGYATAVGLFLNVVNLILLVTVNHIAKKTSETSLF